MSSCDKILISALRSVERNLFSLHCLRFSPISRKLLCDSKLFSFHHKMSAPSDSGGGDHDDGASKMETSQSLVGDYGCSDSDSADEAPELEATEPHQSELSDMVLKNNIINACAHGPLPESSSAEAAADGRHIIIDSSGGGVIEYSVSEYREEDSDDSVSSDSSSEVNSVKDADDVDSSDEDVPERGVPAAPPRVRGELSLDELPPIEELSIAVPSEEVSHVGKIFHMLDKLVIVQAFPGTPAVDLDTVLFLERGKRSLGKVFDVFGPVTEPHYCVRFNSPEQIREQQIATGMDVYIAPRRTDHTNFVFLSQLMKMKGSDASWLHDVEPPPSQLEYSDDEQERRARRERRRRGGEAAAAPGAAEPRAKPTRFEEQMNQRNLQRTAEANSRFGSASRSHRNPFGAVRRPPPAPRPPPPRWGGSWPAEEPPCPPFMLARPTFNPYGPPPFLGAMGMQNVRYGYQPRPHFSRPMNYNRNLPDQGFGQAMPWFVDNPPPPPNT